MRTTVIALMVLASSLASAQPASKKPINYSDPNTIRGMALSPYKTVDQSDQNEGLINVVVPRSTIPLELENYTPPTSHLMFEASASTWLPKSYTNDSYATNTSNYDSAKVPKTSFNFGTDGWTTNSLTIRPKFGMSYQQLSRTGLLPTGGSNVPVSEHLNMYSVRAGAELSLIQEWHRLKPLVNVAVLPTWEQSSSSAFSNGISQNAILVEGQIGGTVRVTNGEVLGTRALSLELGLETARDISDKTLSSSGVFGGLRAEL